MEVTMRPLAAFREELSVPAAEFPQRYPHPFLVYAGGPLRELTSGKTRGLTVDRFVLEGSPRPNEPMSSHFSAVALVPRDPAEKLVTIGVSSTSDITINDGSLSKQHAWFERASDGRWRIWDNDSVSGTQVNGELIKPGYPRALTSDDKITLGYVELTFLSPEAFHLLLRSLLG
jgi:hypothetical protein